MSVIRIEIVAVGEEKMYSVGAVEVSDDGDVYVIDKIKHAGDSHLSRHSSGELHRKIRNDVVKIRKGISIKDFQGIEFLGTHAFGLKSLPQLHKEYEMKKSNGIFAVDMRNYSQAAFNMSIAILTEEGLPRLYETWKKLGKRQIYVFTDCHPMIAIMVADAKAVSEKKE